MLHLDGADKCLSDVNPKQVLGTEGSQHVDAAMCWKCNETLNY